MPALACREIDTKKMASEVARHFNIHSKEVLVCLDRKDRRTAPDESTHWPHPDATDDIRQEYDGAKAFQEAILTSDTCIKSCSAKISAPVGEITIGGVVKGAGMIEPNMATMLAFLTTDIGATNAELQVILSTAVNKFFNRITIDGDMSTNDTVLMMANGNSGIQLGKESKKFQENFAEAVKAVCSALARKCVSDGEKVTKFVRIKVTGAKNTEDAEKVARCVANSLTLKVPGMAPIRIGAELLMRQDMQKWVQILIKQIFITMMFLHSRKEELLVGNKSAVERSRICQGILHYPEFKSRGKQFAGEIWTNDLSEEYVNFNKSE